MAVAVDRVEEELTGACDCMHADRVIDDEVDEGIDGWLDDELTTDPIAELALVLIKVEMPKYDIMPVWSYGNLYRSTVTLHICAARSRVHALNIRKAIWVSGFDAGSQD